MYVYDVTYEDFNGDTQTEKHYFRYSQQELTRISAGGEYTGTPEELLEKIKEAQGKLMILDLVEKFILGAWGERSEDGKHFIKTPEKTEMFKCSLAWEQLFSDISENPDLALTFVRGVMPAKVQAMYDDEKVGERVQEALSFEEPTA